jgi:hypothetical protein
MVTGIYFDVETRQFSLIESTDMYSYQDAAGNVFNSQGKLIARAGAAENFFEGKAAKHLANYEKRTGGKTGGNGPAPVYKAPTAEQSKAYKEAAKKVANKSTAKDFRKKSAEARKNFMASPEYRAKKAQLQMNKFRLDKAKMAGLKKGALIGAGSAAAVGAGAYAIKKMRDRKKAREAAAQA